MVHGFDRLLSAWNSAQETSLYEIWKMELDTWSYLLHKVTEKVLTSLNTVQTTHYMQHVTKYAWETRHLKPPTMQNKKQGTYYTARIWKGLLALALHLPSCCSPDLLCSATTPKKTDDLHSLDPQTLHLLAERNQVISQ
jgi:hypothetical protein